ncbi:MAG: hypothetical protein ABI162_15390 [Luteolibacter sp.]
MTPDLKSFENALDVLLTCLPQKPPLCGLHPLPMGVDNVDFNQKCQPFHLLQYLADTDRPSLFLVPSQNGWNAENGSSWFRNLAALLLRGGTRIEVLWFATPNGTPPAALLKNLTDLTRISGCTGEIRILEPRIGGLPPLVRRTLRKWREQPFLWMDQPRMLWTASSAQADGIQNIYLRYDERSTLQWDLEWRLHRHTIGVIRKFLREVSSFGTSNIER